MFALNVAQAEVVVVPLRVGGGTRIKIPEAMAMGKAVVATAVGAEGLPFAAAAKFASRSGLKNSLKQWLSFSVIRPCEIRLGRLPEGK